MSIFSKEKYYEYDLDEEIYIIATGPYGKIVQKNAYDLGSQYEIECDHEYSDENIFIYYSEKGISHIFTPYNPNCKIYACIYYQGELVYPKKYNSRPDWLDYLHSIYGKSAYERKRLQEEFKAKQERTAHNMKMYKKIRAMFSCTYPNNFSTDKIIVEHYPISTIDVPYDADTNISYNGKITLVTGEVVYDSKNNIYHSGLWEDYVCDLADELIEEQRILQEENNRQYKLKKEREKFEEQQLYEKNHNPIDDSKLFK